MKSEIPIISFSQASWLKVMFTFLVVDDSGEPDAKNDID
jgi:hypothetical protein